MEPFKVFTENEVAPELYSLLHHNPFKSNYGEDFKTLYPLH